MAARHPGWVQADVLRIFDGGSVAGLDDGELLGRFVEDRDEVAFEALVTRLGPMVLGVCRRMLADPHDVDDAFQATFLVLIRRAGSIGDREIVAPWLHGVAAKVARKARDRAARRAAREHQEDADSPAPERPSVVEWSEVRAAIDEEIGRLPEHHRRAVVLCDVEGLTREEAAARLGWTVNMVRGRLDRARGRLRDRLTRRGLAPSGAWLALAPMAPRAALIAMTVRGGMGAEVVSASAMFLCRGVVRMMIFSKVKLAACLMLSVAVVAGMAVAVERQKPATPGADGAVESLDVRISGIVRDQAGKPVAGATVHVVGSKYPEKLLAGATHVVGGSATTGEDGRYLLPAAKLPINRPSTRQPHSTPYVDFQVVAKAPGLAIGWHDRASMFAIPRPDPADKLPRLAMNAPIEMDVSLRRESELKGRVVDEAGRPVAGVKVAVVGVSLIDAQGAEMLSGGCYLDPDLLPEGVGRATTDADGRFRLPGLTSESCCRLNFRRSGSNSLRGLYASTSAEAETTHAFDLGTKRGPHQALPADMTVSMPTTRTVDIRIVAEDDGKPMAGVPVLSLDETISPGISVQVTTDVEGKITFDLPPGSYDGFMTFPDTTEDSKYIGGRLTPFVVTPEPARQAMEFKMERGGEVLIEVVDSETGKGIPGIRFKVVPDSHPDGSYRLHGSGSVHDPNGQPTDANGKLRAVFVPSRKETYRVRVIGVGSLTPGSYAGPGLPSEALPYDAIKAQSDPFMPTGDKPVTLRFVLKKR